MHSFCKSVAILFWPLVCLVAIASMVSMVNADPGAGLPLFRRPQSSAPKASPPRQSVAPAAAAAIVAEVLTEGTTSEPSQGAQVDTAEVLRRGDRVVPAGRGPMSAGNQLIGDAMAPPPDDSHKWFFSLIVDDSKESQALLYDLKHSPELRAWINLDEPKNSWSHATIYTSKDQTQDWRWKGLKISRYPVLLLQPTAKLVNESDPTSWEWGDPKTVVWQWDGYDAASPGRAKVRSDAIRQALVLYVTKMSERRPREQVVGPKSKNAAPRATPGAGQVSTAGPGQDHGATPFSMPVFPQIPGANPVVPMDPMFPSAQPSAPGGAVSQVFGLFQTALGSSGFWVFILVALKAFELFARATPSTADDKIAAFLSSIAAQNPTVKIDQR